MTSEWRTGEPWWDHSDVKVHCILKDGTEVHGTMQVDAKVDEDLEERPYGFVKLGDGTILPMDLIERWREE